MHIENKTGWKDTFVVSNPVLSTKTGLQVKAIQNARAVLQNKGLISFKIRTGNQSAVYKINPFVVLKEQQTGVQTGIQEGAQTGTQEGAQTGVINKLNKTKLNETKKKKYTKEKKFVDDDNLNNTILDFIEFRKNIKSPMTDKAIKLMLNRLNTLAPNDIKKQESILEQSIIQGWKSIYPLKEDDKGGSSYGTSASVGRGIENDSGSQTEQFQTDWDREIEKREREGKLNLEDDEPLPF